MLIESQLIKIKQGAELLEQEYNNAVSKAEEFETYEAYQRYLKPFREAYMHADRRYRNVQPFSLKPIEKGEGELIKLEYFKSCCNLGWYIDYDGFGQYALKDVVSDIIIYPSDITDGKTRSDFDYVLWYNK